MMILDILRKENSISICFLSKCLFFQCHHTQRRKHDIEVSRELQAEAEVVPSSSLVKIEVKVEDEVGVARAP